MEPYPFKKEELKVQGSKNNLQGVFISEEVGYNKPSKEYFEYCFSHIPDFKKEKHCNYRR